jgi:hypothetical protein
MKTNDRTENVTPSLMFAEMLLQGHAKPSDLETAAWAEKLEAANPGWTAGDPVVMPEPLPVSSKPKPTPEDIQRESEQTLRILRERMRQHHAVSQRMTAWQKVAWRRLTLGEITRRFDSERVVHRGSAERRPSSSTRTRTDASSKSGEDPPQGDGPPGGLSQPSAVEALARDVLSRCVTAQQALEDGDAGLAHAVLRDLEADLVARIAA